MREADANLTNPVSLAGIADQNEGPWHSFSEDELGGLWLAQLSSEIQFNRNVVTGEWARKLVELAARGMTIPNRFCDLFRHPNPPVELLEFTKHLAKRAQHQPDSPLQKISTVLYYASIVVALLHCGGRRITGLDDDSLAYGVRWVLEQPWLDAYTRRLFAEALGRLEAKN
ncbi:MAG TPA: hypothetical protein VH475_21215 [Tepidisphaeraceae bacterium]|jgi:hypothetical protein